MQPERQSHRRISAPEAFMTTSTAEISNMKLIAHVNHNGIVYAVDRPNGGLYILVLNT